MNEQQLASFEGYAIVEIMGHQKAAGYVTTQYFGGTAVFRVVQQEMPAEEVTLQRDEWIKGEYIGAGSRVRISRPRAETFVAASSLYRMTPCTEAEAHAQQSRDVEVIERVERKVLCAADDWRVGGDDDDEEEDD